MRLEDARTGIEWIEERECLRLLAGKEVGRLGFTYGGHAEIVPVNYVLDGDAVVFATGPGTKLAGAATGASVVFEIDDMDAMSRSGWSVIIHGTAYEVTDFDRPALVEHVRALPLNPWAGGVRPYLGPDLTEVHHRPPDRRRPGPADVDHAPRRPDVYPASGNGQRIAVRRYQPAGGHSTMRAEVDPMMLDSDVEERPPRRDRQPATSSTGPGPQVIDLRNPPRAQPPVGVDDFWVDWQQPATHR